MRANASAPMALEDCEVAPAGQLTEDGAGFPAMINVVLPLVQSGDRVGRAGALPRRGRCDRKPPQDMRASSISARASAKACRR